jgi:ABC-type polysaccharide/polyol phosphate export permease
MQSELNTVEIAGDMAEQPAKLRARARAITDLICGVGNYRIWMALAWQEIKQRYRRSVLGPLWLTLSTGIMIAAMGPLYNRLLGQALNSYFSYLATSIVVWQMIASMIQDSCQAFIGAEGFIKQTKLPLSVYVLRIIWKNLLIFAHNFIIVLIAFVIYPPHWGPAVIMALAGIFLVALNGLWIGVVIGLVCARFRDVSQIVASIVGVLFFVTPIMWSPKMLSDKEWIIDWNPFYHFMEIVRAPLLGEHLRLVSWLVAIAMTLVGYLLMIEVFGRYRARIAYWV